MIKICEECKIQFNTTSPSPKQCPECREKLLTRVCEICGTVFKAKRPNTVRHTCGKQECINVSISRKFTLERKKAQGAKLAERNRNYYKSLTPEQQVVYIEKKRQSALKQFQNETPEAKAARKAKEMETKSNWTDEQKAQYSKSVSSFNKKRYASMSEQDYKELLGKRFKHLTNVQDFDREFILLNFAGENGVIQFEQRMKIKEYYNLQIGLGGIAQLLKRKFNIESKMFPKVSQGELEIRKILQEWLPNEKVIYNDRNTIPGAFGKFLEIDILYPDLKIGIEFNGTYWHQEKEYSEGLSVEDFKSSKSVEKGFKLFHIWEDDVENGLDMIFTHLNELGILEHLLERFKNTSNQSKNTSKIVEVSSIQ